MSGAVSFPVFLVTWNRMQGQATPDLHRHMAGWLESRWHGGDRRLLLQAFRSSGKSTLTGLFAAWLLHRDPDLRIVVLAADLALARKMVRNVRRIVERHPLTQTLRPERADQWGGDRFTVRRRKELRDPSMLAKGISANLTGSRADVIICDDVEVPNTCDTAAKREDLRERLAELEFILVPGGMLLYLGTPHHWFSIYAATPRLEMGETRPFLGDFRRLSIPVLDRRGLSAWPERFTEEDIARMRAAAGPSKFSSQMMLVPVNSADGRLDPALLNTHDDELVYEPVTRDLSLGGRRLVACGAWWDPAFGQGGGRKSGDSSVVAVIFADDAGRYYLQHLAYLTARDDPEIDEAAQQCRAVAQVAKRFRVPLMAVETNGIGKFLPNILKREMALARVPCGVIAMVSKRSKDDRILEAFDAPLAARLLSVHDSVRRTPFLTEMQEWRPKGPGGGHGRDDGLDAVAGALSRLPPRSAPGFAGRPLWPPGGGRSYEVRFDFDVN